jgi:hypothetical protein
MIKLSDAELSAIMTACQPLAPAARDGLVRAVANALQSCAEVGPGSVHRAIVAAQREHFSPPDLSAARDQSKWR